MSINWPKKVVTIFFQLDKSAKEAISQIKNKGYLDAYRNDGKRRIAIGINFSKKDKIVSEMEWEEIHL